MNGPVCRVTRAGELGALLVLPAPARVVLDVAEMPSDEASIWQREIDQRLRSCGCDEATAAFLLNLGALAAFAWWRWPTVVGAPWLCAGIGIVWCCLAIGVGKAFGRWRGRRRLVASVNRLHAVLARRIAT